MGDQEDCHHPDDDPFREDPKDDPEDSPRGGKEEEPDDQYSDEEFSKSEPEAYLPKDDPQENKPGVEVLSDDYEF